MDEVIFGKESWDWLNSKKWVWLTNCQTTNVEFIMRVEEMYGQKNVQINKQAYDNNRVPLSANYVALFVDRKTLEKQIATGKGILPTERYSAD